MAGQTFLPADEGPVRADRFPYQIINGQPIPAAHPMKMAEKSDFIDITARTQEANVAAAQQEYKQRFAGEDPFDIFWLNPL